MIAFVSVDSARQLRRVRPQVQVAYRGGRDEIIAGPKWGWRTQELRFCFRVSVSGGGTWTARRLGRMDIEGRMMHRLRRVTFPVGVVLRIDHSPAFRPGLSERAVSVVYTTTAPWEEELATGRMLWDGVPLTVGQLGAILLEETRRALRC
jgi:hypothetical protein